MKISVVMATHNKAGILDLSLKSIFVQMISSEFEVIVVDDDSTDDTKSICSDYPVRHIPIENDSGLPYRNPSHARNVGYKVATGDIIICQSDDVMHQDSDTLEALCEVPVEGQSFALATVTNYNLQTNTRLMQYVGVKCRRPFFFLGALYRSDLYAIGGNSEDFVYPAYDDDWFADCLIRGRRLMPIYMESIEALHIDHSRPQNIADLVKPSRALYAQKVKDAKAGRIKWEAIGGPWEL